MPDESSSPRSFSAGWLAVAAPLLLLAWQVALLTLTVEYRHGPMARVAQPQFIEAAMIAVTVLLLLSGAEMAAVARRGWLAARALWLAVNLASFALLYLLSHHLAQSDTPSTAGVLAWIALAAAVGASAMRVGASWETLRAWTKIAWRPALIAIALGATVAWGTPDIRRTWHLLGPPTSRLAQRFLELRHPGNSILALQPGKDPVIGAWSTGAMLDVIKLRVTPACSEMESLAVFLLLALTLLIARWSTVRVAWWLAAVSSGLFLLWILCAVRLALLVELGLHTNATWSVRLAHSRASGMFFLAFSSLWLIGTSYGWQVVPQEMPETSRQPT